MFRRTHSLRFLLTLLIIGLVSVGSLRAHTAHAQLFGAPLQLISTIRDVPRELAARLDQIRAKLASKYKDVTAIAFKSGIQIFQDRLLQEVKTSLASVGPGQKPLFVTKPLTFFKDVSNAAAGDYIDDFTRGVTGETGPGTDLFGKNAGGRNLRSRFLISRLLRSQAGLVVNGVSSQCKLNCTTSFTADLLDTDALKVMSQEKFNSYFKSSSSFQNLHEKNIAFVTYQLDGPTGTNKILEGNKTADGDCLGISEGRTNGSAITWIIDTEATYQEGHFPGKLQDCKAYQDQALNVELSTVATDRHQCVANCQVRNDAATSAIDGFTATDIFSAVKNADVHKAPAALANIISHDSSDIGRFLTAAGALTATVQEAVTGQQTNLNPNIFPVATRVSGEVKSPSPTATELLGIPFTDANGKFVYTGSSVADVLRGALSFINSPVGKALKNYFSSKCGLNPDLCKGPSNARSTIGQLVFGSGSPTGTAGAQLLYADIGQPEITTGDPGNNQISVVDQLTANGLINSAFGQAIENTLTVKQALDQHYLDPKKTFGFDQSGIEPRNGYPYRALQYLRKYRVTPVGWELAAKYSQQFDHQALSFGYLIGAYNMCGQDETHNVCASGPNVGKSCRPDQADTDCGKDGNGTAISCGASPYCGLVDPNWVLKAPATFCRRQGAGEEVISKGFVCDQNNIDATTGNVILAGVTCDAKDLNASCSDIAGPNCVSSANNPNPDIGHWLIERNTDTCADSQSCIAENDDGTCQAYGYCVQERNVFKFDGTQCSAENSSCTAYTDSIGLQVAYLANTLDSSNCTADNAGCTKYCAASSYDATTQTCDNKASINFTGKVQSCDESQVGCQQFLRTAGGTNLLTNSGFETYDQPIDSNNSANYSGWTKIPLNTTTLGAYPVTASDTAITANNTSAVRLTGGATDGLSQVFSTGYDLYERTFTLSVRAKANAACSATLSLEVDSTDANRPRVPANGQSNMDITTGWDTYDISLSIPGNDVINLGTNYALKASLLLGNCSSQSLTIDSAQLEETAGPTQYKEYGTANTVYLNGNRQQCTVADVGCQAYTPSNGDPVVYGQVRSSNYCSADKVGCNSLKLEPITSVPTRAGGAVNVVVPKGEICSAEEVGCEEYTNLDEVAKGGEGKEYYTAVKQCIKPSQVGANNPVASTYYTWVGDAKLGYVLRAYDLVKTDNPTNGGGNAPCTSLKAGTSNAAPTCNDTAPTISAATCSVANVATNPDCAQFYDSALTIYYRLRSKTVTVTDDCHPYRNTLDQSDPGANKDSVYYLSTTENTSCQPQAAGCRAYTGNASGTTRTVFNDTFESNGVTNWVGGSSSNASVNLNGHSMSIALQGTSPAAATKVLKDQIFGGRSYLVTFTAAASDVSPATITASFGTVNGNGYQPTSAATTFPGTATATYNKLITPSGPEWKSFTLGPLTILADLPNAQLGFQIKGDGVYIDNVSLSEVNDHIYMISSSVPQCSVTEVGCSAYTDSKGQKNYLTSFTRLCSEKVVGCEAMIDTQNSSTPFKQTVKGVVTEADSVTTMVNNPANYCQAASKGCGAFGQPVYGPDQALLNYQTKYLISNPDRYTGDLCLANELMCQAYTTSDGTAAYFKDPGQGVCTYSTSGDGNGQWVITGTSQPCPIVTPPTVGRPIGASCSPICVGGNRDGKACTLPGGSNECSGGACVGSAATIGQVYDLPSKSYVVGSCSTTSDCRKPTDTTGNTCLYLAGSCPTEQNTCTEYRDPSDPANCRAECPLTSSQGGSADYLDGSCQLTQCGDGKRQGQNCQADADCFDGAVHQCVGANGQPATGIPGCRSYYYLQQSIQTNLSSCNGKVDPKIGCMPFNDTTNPNLNFRGQ